MDFDDDDFVIMPGGAANANAQQLPPLPGGAANVNAQQLPPFNQDLVVDILDLFQARQQTAAIRTRQYGPKRKCGRPYASTTLQLICCEMPMGEPEAVLRAPSPATVAELSLRGLGK